MTAVVFSYSDWSLRYPELAVWTSQPLAQLYFNEAGLYCDNGDTSPITDLTQRAMLLGMVTAHIAQLNAQLNGQASPQLVGRISSAGQGSVNVSTEMNMPGTAAWFMQTKYGAAFWQATVQYRTMQYAPGYPRNQDPYGYPFFTGGY